MAAVDEVPKTLVPFQQILQAHAAPCERIPPNPQAREQAAKGILIAANCGL